MKSYRYEVLRTAPPEAFASERDRLAVGALGLAGESGEAVDLIKKHLYHGATLDRAALVKELGDVRWYLELLAIAADVTMEEIEDANVAKLRARYPDGFVKGGGVRAANEGSGA